MPSRRFTKADGVASRAAGLAGICSPLISEASVSNRRELYQSPSGDCWYLGREPENGRAFIIHQPNGPSGGQLSHIELGVFLSDGSGKPEQQALLRLIGALVDVPPYGDRT